MAEFEPEERRELFIKVWGHSALQTRRPPQAPTASTISRLDKYPPFDQRGFDVTRGRMIEASGLDRSLARLTADLFAHWESGLRRAAAAFGEAGPPLGLREQLFVPFRGELLMTTASAPLQGLMARGGFAFREQLYDERILLGRLTASDRVIAELYLSDIVLAPGSLNFWGALQFLVGTGVLTSVILSCASPFVGDWHNDLQWNSRIEQVVEGGVCRASLDAIADISHLRRMSSEDLNPDVQGLSPDERSKRICLIQLLLRLNGFSPGPIDGVDGFMTKQAEREFAKSHHLRPSQIRTRPYFDALLDGVQHDWK
ncbi:peptidoglycan-binding domain-containing protein [Phenylobacterium sp. LjRoot219]|uniref:peptidoglycan-binding domain-containing protein n=1 Tax=Phenylobacterium sp. LjRoot219 TaxID=3342283 RepID=UPI003ECE4ED7